MERHDSRLVYASAPTLEDPDQFHSLYFSVAVRDVVLATAGVHAQEAFQVLSNASLTHYEVAYIVMFAIPLLGVARLRKTLPRWLKWTSVLGLGATLFSLLISAYPFVSAVNPLSYAIKIVGTLLLSNLLAVTFYKLRTRPVVAPAVAENTGFETEG
jgi:glutamate:GABA antiporter